MNFPRPNYSPPEAGTGAAPSSGTSASPSAPATSSPPGGTSPASSSNAAPAPTEAPKLAESGSPAPVVAPPGEGLPETPVEDFIGLGGEDDVLPLPSDEELGATPPEAPPVVPPQTPPAAPPVEPPKAPSPAEAPPAPAEAAPKEQPSSTPMGPQALAQQLDEHRTEVLQRLATTEFALSREEAEAVGPEMAALAPQLAARTYHRAVQSSLLHMQNFVPLIVASVVQAINSSNEKEGKFYGQFKYLDKAKHAADVNQFLQVFRQREPNLTEEQLWAKAAAAVKALHGLQDAVTPPAAPNGSQIPRVPPFIPATPGGGGARVEQIPNPWEGFGQPDVDEG